MWIERSLFAPAFTSKLQKLLGGRPTSRATAAAPAKKLKKQPTPVDDAALVDEFMKTASAIDESQRQDAQVAGQVAALPTELFDVDEMFKITDIATGAKLQLQADSACTLLAQRQGRLVAEADDRQNLIRVVSKVLETQKRLALRAERQLQECEGNLEQIEELETALVDKMLYLPAEASAVPAVSAEKLASSLPTKDNTQTEDMDLSDSDDGGHAAGRGSARQGARPSAPQTSVVTRVHYEYSYASDKPQQPAPQQQNTDSKRQRLSGPAYDVTRSRRPSDAAQPAPPRGGHEHDRRRDGARFGGGGGGVSPDDGETTLSSRGRAAIQRLSASGYAPAAPYSGAGREPWGSSDPERRRQQPPPRAAQAPPPDRHPPSQAQAQPPNPRGRLRPWERRR